jgi:hypothetical protein
MNTSTLETMTGFEAINRPKVIHSAAPTICRPRNIVGLEKKYDATNTAVAIHPTVSAIGRLDRLMELTVWNLTGCPSSARRSPGQTIAFGLGAAELRIIQGMVGPFAR